MKFLSALLLASGLAVFTTSAGAATVNGQNYAPLGNWARANGLTAFWSRHGEEITATNRTARLVFTVNSAEAEINGVNVRLSFPVANVKDVPLIAQLDLDKTVAPLLFPSRFVEPKKITTICLDPGHGGKDKGNIAGEFFSHYEKNYTLPLAFELRDQLKAFGFKVFLTRTTDTFVDLSSRPAIANKVGADLFVSLHFNAAQTDKDTVEGPETYCITPVGASSSNDSEGESANHGASPANRFENKSLLLAYQMQKSLVQNLGVQDRDVRRARFAVLRDTTMPAILIEGGYMTNPTESKKIYDSTYRKQMAAAMVKGILAYQKLTAPVAPVVVSTNRPAKKVPIKKTPA